MYGFRRRSTLPLELRVQAAIGVAGDTMPLDTSAAPSSAPFVRWGTAFADSRLLQLFLLGSVLLCAPSYAAWFRTPFDIGRIEFDPWLAVLSSPWPGQVAHAIGFAVLGILYVAIARRSVQLPRWYAPAVWIIFFVAVPWMSPDVMYYLSKGWIEAGYGQNPYTSSVAAVPNFEQDPMFYSMVPSLLHLRGNYGALFQKLSALLANLADGDPLRGLLLFKMVMSAALFGCYRLVRVVAAQAHVAVEDLDKWFLLNPLLLFNFVTAAHNDVLLMLLILAGVVLLHRKQFLLAGSAIGLSIGFKIAGIFLLPAYAITTVMTSGWTPSRRRLAAAAIGVLAGAGAGFLVDPSSSSFFKAILLHEANGFRSSIHMLLSPLVRGMNLPGSPDSLLIGKCVFVAAALHLHCANWRQYRHEPFQFLVVCSFETFVLLQFLVMPAMAEWYILWPLCFALCCPGSAARQWCRRITVLYMPIAIWHVVGIPQLVMFAQLSIVGFLFVSHAGYFMRSRVAAS